ncbi:hypothetical protein NXW88_01940 [Bacteroides cellulosilyticus]|mgnify:FL=1|jgi:hypothetical protein|uniref:Uncharacterized protein n=1 Tax=Bacteroides cellulosilyticus TaxID=246787 RepID=A0A0P0GAE1_9BACE|nr:hypothetical protein [Bacteroides cellulosilyticus]ALJ59208.1 hypothetical protein BcellWH2_01963 [Bacteroides cellulosilyticus]RGQ09043.1 hypothetical protein DWZ09_25160 [Bacteroides cellulosilyticus]UVP51729.1 hypothetical protein NXW88_01940 [Bacteroides cellulosilyticus]DAN19184.1 MAG TPA: hypothetical protein [Caudoviricetes sp.]
MKNELEDYLIEEYKGYDGSTATTVTGRVEGLVLTCYLRGKHFTVTEYDGKYSITHLEDGLFKVYPILPELVKLLMKLPVRPIKELE